MDPQRENDPSQPEPAVEPEDQTDFARPTDADNDVEGVDNAATSETAPERPPSTTVGTGSFFGIGCTIFALLFVCVGVAIFMWRQAN